MIKKRGLKRILSVVLALLLTLCLVFSLAACDFTLPAPPDPGGGVVPDPTPDPPPPDPEPEIPQDMPLETFLARAYNAVCENFTLRVQSRSENNGDVREADVFRLVHDSGKYSLDKDGVNFVYADGLAFTEQPQSEVPDTDADEREKGDEPDTQAPVEPKPDLAPLYSAMEMPQGYPALKPIEQRKLEALLELAGVQGTVTGSQTGYRFETAVSLEKQANAVLAVLRRDIDERAIVAVTDVVNVLSGNAYTEEEAAALLAYYGDTPLKTLLADGKILSEQEFSVLYNTVKGLLSGAYEIPSYGDFMKRYGALSLCELLKKGSVKDLLASWEDKTLYELLRVYPYTAATWGDFFRSAVEETAFALFRLDVSLHADENFIIDSFAVRCATKLLHAPVFKAALADGGVQCDYVFSDRTRTLSGTFSQVGKSAVTAPERYVVVGEKRILVKAAGEYPFHSGTQNVKYNADGSLAFEIESQPIADDDMKVWVELFKKIKKGTAADYDRKVLTFSEEAYENLVKAVEMGMTRLTVRAFKELNFTVEVL